MDASQVTYLLSMLRCDKIRLQSNGWVEATCPFAPWLHVGGKDRHPSFAVSTREGMSRYRCHGCGSKGDIVQMMWKLKRFTGSTYQDLWPFVQRTNAPTAAELEGRLKHAEYWRKASEGAPSSTAGVDLPPLLLPREPVELPVLPETELDKYEGEFPPNVRNYLEGRLLVDAGDGICVRQRGLKPDTIEDWGLCWDESSRRIAIPIRDRDGNLVAISGRAWPPWRKPKYFHTKGFHRDYYLFGENLVQEGRPGIVVEGHFDVINLVQHGFVNVLGLMGSYISRIQIEKLVKWCTQLILIPDADEPGRRGFTAVRMQTARYLPTTVLDLPEGMDPGDMCAADVKKYLAGID